MAIPLNLQASCVGYKERIVKVEEIGLFVDFVLEILMINR